jgi:hypothetical protein
MSFPNAFEEERRLRMLDNKAKLEELGFQPVQNSKQLKEKQSRPKKPHQPVDDSELRRSNRKKLSDQAALMSSDPQTIDPVTPISAIDEALKKRGADWDCAGARREAAAKLRANGISVG